MTRVILFGNSTIFLSGLKALLAEEKLIVVQAIYSNEQKLIQALQNSLIDTVIIYHQKRRYSQLQEYLNQSFPQIRVINITNEHLHTSEHELLKPQLNGCFLYTSPSPRDQRGSRMPSSA